MKQFIISLLVLSVTSLFGQTKFLFKMDSIKEMERLDYKFIRDVLQLENVTQGFGTNYYLASKFLDYSGGASTIIVGKEISVGSIAYLMSYTQNGDLIDKKKIMEALDNENYNSSDIDIFYELEDKKVTMTYRIISEVKSNDVNQDHSLDIYEYNKYVSIDNSGYFFELSSSEEKVTERMFPEASKRAVTESDLKGLSSDELAIMRNEIFAAHHYIFKSDRYSSYFGKKEWYTPKYENVLDKLSNIEKDNIQKIKKLEIK